MYSKSIINPRKILASSEMCGLAEMKRLSSTVTVTQSVLKPHQGVI
jgi:hypothetical protein